MTDYIEKAIALEDGRENMFESILVLLDTPSIDALHVQQARYVAEKLQAKLILTYLLKWNELLKSPFVDPLAWSLQKVEVEDMLNNFAQQLSSEHLEVCTLVIENDSAEALTRQIEQKNVSLIVLSKSSENMSDRWHQLMKSTRVPVLSIPQVDPVQGQYNKILVPLDGSQRAECILPLLIGLNKAFDCEIILAHVVQSPSSIYMKFKTNEEASLLKQLTDSNKRKAEQYLRDLASRIAIPTEIKVILDNDVSGSIHQLVEDEKINLLVMSAHGESGNPKLPYGNITHNMISYSDIPVLVLQDLPTAIVNKKLDILASQRYFTMHKSV